MWYGTASWWPCNLSHSVCHAMKPIQWSDIVLNNTLYYFWMLSYGLEMYIEVHNGIKCNEFACTSSTSDFLQDFKRQSSKRQFSKRQSSKRQSLNEAIECILTNAHDRASWFPSDRERRQWIVALPYISYAPKEYRNQIWNPTQELEWSEGLLICDLIYFHFIFSFIKMNQLVIDIFDHHFHCGFI